MDTDQGAVTRIVEAARAASGGQDSEPLQAAVRDAAPNDRALAAKELADDGPARGALHTALRDLGISTESGAN